MRAINKLQQSYWLFLYPYVYIAIKKRKAILYNTLNGVLLEFSETEKEIVKLLEKLNSDNHLYVTRTKQTEINRNLAHFIDKIRETYSGDIVDTAFCPHKPFQAKPILNLHMANDYFFEGGKENKIPVSDNIKDYLNILTIYINGICEQTCPMCQTAFKQFLCCRKNQNSQNEVNHEDISKLLTEIKNSSLKKINLIGGNIFKHSNLISIVEMLNPLNIIKIYYIHYLNIKDNPCFFNMLRAGKEKNRLNITVHFPLVKDAFNSAFKQIQNEKLSFVKFDFVIESEEDMLRAEEIISAHEIKNFEFCPYYNGSNLVFFKEKVFINREALAESQPGMNDIFARQIVNTLEFKKLMISNSKAIFANPNNPTIGRLGKENIFHLVFQELHKGKSWTKVRKNVMPCKSCIFNALCPPISSYEYALGRYNLCNLKT